MTIDIKLSFDNHISAIRKKIINQFKVHLAPKLFFAKIIIIMVIKNL